MVSPWIKLFVALDEVERNLAETKDNSGLRPEVHRELYEAVCNAKYNISRTLLKTRLRVELDLE